MRTHVGSEQPQTAKPACCRPIRQALLPAAAPGRTAATAAAIESGGKPAVQQAFSIWSISPPWPVWRRRPAGPRAPARAAAAAWAARASAPAALVLTARHPPPALPARPRCRGRWCWRLGISPRLCRHGLWCRRLRCGGDLGRVRGHCRRRHRLRPGRRRRCRCGFRRRDIRRRPLRLRLCRRERRPGFWPREEDGRCRCGIHHRQDHCRVTGFISRGSFWLQQQFVGAQDHGHPGRDSTFGTRRPPTQTPFWLFRSTT